MNLKTRKGEDTGERDEDPDLIGSETTRCADPEERPNQEHAGTQRMQSGGNRNRLLPAATQAAEAEKTTLTDAGTANFGRGQGPKAKGPQTLPRTDAGTRDRKPGERRRAPKSEPQILTEGKTARRRGFATPVRWTPGSPGVANPGQRDRKPGVAYLADGLPQIFWRERNLQRSRQGADARTSVPTGRDFMGS